MKKIYLTGGLVLAGLLATAQTTYKIAKKDIKNGRITHAERVAPSNGSVQQVAGGIICATQYTAGTTMDLSLTYTSANATGDLEYVDYLEITFPAGITPTGAGNTSTTFPNATDAGGGLETLNPAAGQVISWGVQAGTDEYGGIWAPTGETFVVEVNVTAGLTGPQTANFTLDGDGFTGAPGVTTPGVGTTASGTFLINPAGTPAPDLTTTFVQPLSVTTVNNCNYGLDTIVAQIKNTGNTTESNINVMYRVNGGASFTEVVAGPLAPGDSAYVFWLSAPFDFTASNIYNIEAWATATGDINTANDTASQVIVNSQSLALTSAQYNNGVETAYEQNSVIFDGTAAQFTGLSTGTFHSGLVAYFTTVSAANPAGTYEYKAILPCMDVVNGETYRISFWKRTNAASNGNGQTGVFTGLTPTNAGMTTILKAYNPPPTLPVSIVTFVFQLRCVNMVSEPLKPP